MVEPQQEPLDRWADWLLHGRQRGMSEGQLRRMDAVLRRVRDRVLGGARLRRGQRVLDVGAGTGLLTLDACRRVGPTGQVVAVDRSHDALAVCRRPAGGDAAAPMPACAVGDATALPFADQAFDVVLVRSVLMYVADRPAAIRELRRVLRPGGRVSLFEPIHSASRQYGAVAYNLLAVVVERVTGSPFGAALGTLVLEPLGIEAYFGVEPPRLPAAVADIRDPHVGTPLEPLNSPFFRALALPAGGLLTTAGGALALVRAFQGRPAGFLHPETTTEATRNQAGDLGGGLFGPLSWTPCPWGLGPELHGEKTPHWAPRNASPASFGHVGGSGCLAWADPTADVAWAILGARTFLNDWPRRHGAEIGAAILASP